MDDSIQSAALSPADSSADMTASTEQSGVSTYGSFWIGETEFTLRADEVREVVPFPESVTEIPRAPKHVMGVFDLRGEIVPVVCIATLLGLDPPEYKEGDARVAIVDCGEDQIGGVFSRTGSVFRVGADELQPLHHAPGEANPIVSALLRLDNGHRLVQVLSAELIAQVDHIPRGASRRDELLEEEETPKRRFVVVGVGPHRLAIDGDRVIEIQEGMTIQSTASYFDHFGGMVTLRGESLPVIKLGEALGTSEEENAQARRMVVVHDDHVVGALLVNTVVDVFEIDEDGVSEVPMLRRLPTGEMCHQVVRRQNGDYLMLLDVPELFRSVGFAKGLAGDATSLEKLRPSADAEDSDFKQLSYLVFMLGGERLALPLESVREIQDFPAHMLRPPGEDTRFIGMMPLRGSIISLVDLRARYSLGGETPVEQTKVLVLDAGIPVGLLVDTLKGIVHTDASAKLQTQEWMLPNAEEKQQYHQDLDCILRIEGNPMLALDPVRLMDGLQAG